MQSIRENSSDNVGKLNTGVYVAAVQPSANGKSLRLFVYDKLAKLWFLIDTGSDVSVIPVNVERRHKGKPPTYEYKLYAANGTRIGTHG